MHLKGSAHSAACAGPGAGKLARGVHMRRVRGPARPGAGVRGPAWFPKSYPNWVRPYPNWVRLGELQNLDADADAD
jgi:hypothetical protein